MKAKEYYVSVEFENKLTGSGFIQFSYPDNVVLPKIGETVIYETEASRVCYSGKVFDIRHNVSGSTTMVTIRVKND